MDVNFIQHKNKKILYVDYRGAKNEEQMFELLKKDIDIEKSLTEKTPLLVNFEDSYISQKYIDEIKKYGGLKKRVISKMALVGVTGVKVILFKAYLTFTGQKDTKLFDSEDDAKEWLVL